MLNGRSGMNDQAALSKTSSGKSIDQPAAERVI